MVQCKENVVSQEALRNKVLVLLELQRQIVDANDGARVKIDTINAMRSIFKDLFQLGAKVDHVAYDASYGTVTWDTKELIRYSLNWNLTDRYPIKLMLWSLSTDWAISNGFINLGLDEANVMSLRGPIHGTSNKYLLSLGNPSRREYSFYFTA